MVQRKTWIFVGIVLWGIPTGIMFSLFLSIIDLKSKSGLREFVFGDFLSTAYVMIPLFSIFGLILGSILYKFGEKRTHDETQSLS